MLLPPKFIESQSIKDVDTILKPLEITYNENYFTTKYLPLPGEPFVPIYLTNDPPTLK